VQVNKVYLHHGAAWIATRTLRVYDKAVAKRTVTTVHSYSDTDFFYL